MAPRGMSRMFVDEDGSSDLDDGGLGDLPFDGSLSDGASEGVSGGGDVMDDFA